MKRLNIIIIADEGEQNSVVDPYAGADIEGGVALLNSMINENPSLAEDKGIQELLKTSELVKQEDIKAGIIKPDGEQVSSEDNNADENKADESEKEKSPLSSLPFFKDDGTESQVDLKALTPENFHEFASKLGVDTTKDGWVGLAIEKAAEQKVQPLTQFEKQYNELVESINVLPKEVQTVVQLAIDGKDWKSAISGAASLDLSKDFNSLSADEKIKIHNYYFPEDSIQQGEDVTKKDVSKSLKAAEAKYSSDKYVASANEVKLKNEKAESQRKFLTSVDTSISELKKEYPDFKERDLKAAEEIVKKGGIYNQFFDTSGNLTKDGFKKLIFALHGESILKVATSIAENKGRSKGKNEVLSVEQGVDKNKNNGANELTNVEKSVNKLVGASMVGQNLTY